MRHSQPPIRRAVVKAFDAIRSISDAADEGAVEDYPAFAKKAAERSAKIVLRAVTYLS